MHPYNLAILIPGKPNNTETFINKHIERLPFNITVIYGDDIPYMVAGDESLNNDSIISRFILRIGFNKKKDLKELKLARLKKHLTAKKIQLVLAEYLIVASSVYEVCKDLKIPIIATGLGYDLTINDLLQKNQLQYRSLFNYCSAVVIVAKYFEKILLDLGLDKSKIVYSPIGAGTDFLNIHPEFNCQQVFALGRFVDKKAPHLSILSFYSILKHHPSARLVLAGDGPLLSFCTDLVKGLRIEKNVLFPGKISTTQQLYFLSTSMMFIQHSRTAINGDSEGTPVAIVEASAAGLPVISTTHGGIVDVIIDKQTGFLVSENDVSAMSEKINYLFENPEQARIMGAKGKDHVRLNFTLEKHLDLMEHLILRVLRNCD